MTGTDRLISMTAINFHDDIFDHIRQFQFYQEEKGALNSVTSRRNAARAVLRDVRRRLMVKLGDDVELAMKPVKDIPLTARGKHRFLIQKLPWRSMM